MPEGAGARLESEDPLARTSATIDRTAGAVLALMTGGVSPASIAAAFGDWLGNLASSPGTLIDLGTDAIGKGTLFGDYVRSSIVGQSNVPPCILPAPQDRRFAADDWREMPFNLLQQAFLLAENWWDQACRSVGGTTRRHEDVVRFVVRQMLDMVAPSNFVATNPVVQRHIAETGGTCLLDGWTNLLDDQRRWAGREPPKGADAFRPGVDVAVTPGDVVFRNHLIELIRYRPVTEKVRPEPVLIVPAWIMKYYILDLSPQNSLVRWLVAQGFTVFMISWRNPDAKDRDIGFDDYRRLGAMAALDAISRLTGTRTIHAAGYCLGGTLLAITAATMARDGDDRLASMTLFAAQTEFSEPGELGLFIDASQIHVLENLMWAQGYLDSRQMGGAFQMLRSNDLVWSRIVHDYLMGEVRPLTDMMAWNADGTRLPQAMHSQYLRELFLEDALAEGRFRVDGRTISLGDIDCPVFTVATEWDHVAPWRSVFKIHLLTDTDITFVLASGGHNAGIVAAPGDEERHFRIMTHAAASEHVDADDWIGKAELRRGSWWSAWGDWLASRSGTPVACRPMDEGGKNVSSLDPAPGRYVFRR